MGWPCGAWRCCYGFQRGRVNAGSSENEAPEIPDNVGDWLRGVYRFATDRNDFQRNLILNLGLFAAGVWLARNLSDIDLMAPQPGM
ncbi:mitochondrial import receptor subunit TOM6 homolog [Pipistrellus kuhlii]|uniref:mitochondrial import receptor subunit TOM6 homolog n=1 Tax=Pipistrellus kuhlii TaxID=59472 RepID=UPI00174F40A3|nr:mitochondrial import receptor subunit TOM6 homolog [Pipistrellus kuhlii]